MLIGIVGKPNAGKSTYFRAATLAPAEISPRPFTTIKPNRGVGHVRVPCPCKKLGIKCSPKQGMCIEGTRFVPVQMLDVAGLVPGASEGRGLGNQFLDDLRRADAIIHVVDASGTVNDEGQPGEGNPVHDTEWLMEEFELWIADIIRRTFSSRTPGEDLKKRLVGLGIDEKSVEGILRAKGTPSEDNLREFSKYIRQLKPVVIAANKADLSQSEKWLEKLKTLGGIPTSAESELALKLAAKSGLINYHPGAIDFKTNGSIATHQQEALEKIRHYLKKFGSTGVQDVLEKAVKTLDMITVYPVEDEAKFSDGKGNILPDAYLVPRGTTPRQLAFLIHTDIGEKFVASVDARTKLRLSADGPLEDQAIVKIQVRK